MTEESRSVLQLNELEQDVLLEEYRQRYRHVQHSQHMRATYFNLFLVIVVGMMALLAATFDEKNQELRQFATFIVGFVIWVTAILVMMRVVRWGGAY